MSRPDRFGEIVEGYDIPVLNEREIRAAAGIFFVFLLIAVMVIVFKQNFLMLKYMISLFLFDFAIRVFVRPKYAPSMIIGRFIVGNQTPEYVGAAQKKFAWVFGLLLAVIMFGLMVVANTFSFVTGLICMTCLIFLSFESMFGICLGCLFYKWFYREKARYCPGEVCDVKAKQDIQKISLLQVIALIGFVVLMLAAAFKFGGKLSPSPRPIWGSQSLPSHGGAPADRP
ncbi:MAG TPA: DUF4395 domain-containing protein [Elusimicrobia bacterium]|nr:MAG: hypothetical protein A2278_06285 [Elusimicrobia bacterium RIFOXYA12_FULL_49_49]OGS08359.1 MAG: hypothetical protein A2204_07775 [Elusimicrobia bacterium RIFOXYA1_FULL_47_7]OGS09624.1 MAG: hypothetical protein A2386_08205 [Elusimicrobia bacterium RIFOXYB1_FULL_48_9]OGS16602.1 MAG: hypothetical protein A2251_04450 [Elusimicrobia bacterium RIFOXYA2_FULL_47_53]OGS25825.1 MAG: hypothetical protein A2339_00070 [Elusimicrobia bacterium RIFOXYB12_FULL_50_12]OGS31580.1 MAG: hypothetical protein